MSGMLFPIPVNTPILDSPNQFNISWQKYLKAVGDDLLTANKIVTINPDFNYTVNGNICFFNYSRTVGGNIEIKLPYKLALPLQIGDVVYPKDTSTITIQSSINYVQGFYFIIFKTGRN